MRPPGSIDWNAVNRVLVIRLRSIGDTVLATPTLTALRRHLPEATIDVLLEDWVAPLLAGHPAIDSVISIGKGNLARLSAAREIRRRQYDLVINLHGGTTSTFLTRATGARYRVGISNFQYAFLYTDLLSSSAEFWNREHTHSAEQQLAVAGSIGVPVEDRPPSSLSIDAESADAVDEIIATAVGSSDFALMHPAAAFKTKEWPAENFARIAEYFAALGLKRVAVASPSERGVLEEVASRSRVPIVTLESLSLPQVVALASRARIFIGNDSGIAHIAAAVGTPSVVVFGSSNREHWRPWSQAPNEIVFNKFECQPCAGYVCEAFGQPRCIAELEPAKVIDAIDRVLEASG